MAKVDLQTLKQELDRKKLRSVYLLVGQERLRMETLAHGVLDVVFENQPRNDFNFDRCYANEIDLSVVVDRLGESSFFGGTKVFWLKGIEAVKDWSVLLAFLKQEDVLGRVGPVEEFQSILILSGSSLDQRRKSHKELAQKIGVTACEKVEDHDREGWIESLAKRRKIEIDPREVQALRALDPWSLELVDSELQKLEVLKNEDLETRLKVISNGIDPGLTQAFIRAVLSKDRKTLWSLSKMFGDQMDVILPILGLLAWNVRQLKALVLAKEQRISSQSIRISGYGKKQVEGYVNRWTPEEISRLEKRLLTMDLGLKSTRKWGAGYWMELVDL